MSCCGATPGYDELDEVSKLVSTKLAAFLRTLCDNGFAVGLQEGQDAASLMAAGYAARPGLLRSALKHLFSARKSDWEKFDGLFDAFWLGKRIKSRSVTMGSAKAANSPSLKSLQDTRSERSGGEAMNQIPSTEDAPEDRAGEGRMEGASRADNLSEIDFRKMADPEQIEHLSQGQEIHGPIEVDRPINPQRTYFQGESSGTSDRVGNAREKGVVEPREPRDRDGPSLDA